MVVRTGKVVILGQVDLAGTIALRAPILTKPWAGPLLSVAALLGLVRWWRTLRQLPGVRVKVRE
jgi:hypothetical protein